MKTLTNLLSNELVISLIVFTVCSLINVMLNTIKTLVMYKKNTLSSATINAITYGFYTIIVVLMAGEIPLLWKILLTAVSNFIGVAVSMNIMNRMEKDKLWKVEATVKSDKQEVLCEMLNNADLSFNFIEGVGEYTVFNVFCSTQKESHALREILNLYDAKFFVSESKTL